MPVKTTILLSLLILASCHKAGTQIIEPGNQAAMAEPEDNSVNYSLEYNSTPQMPCKMITRIEYKSSQEIIDEIEKNGTDINCKDSFGYSIVMLALLEKKIDLVHYLLDRNVDLSTIVDQSNIAHYHCQWNWGESWDAELMSELMKKGVDIHLSDKWGNQPLWHAAFNNKGFGRTLDMVEVLLMAGADMHHKNNVGKSPKMLAVSMDDLELLKLFNKYDKR